MPSSQRELLARLIEAVDPIWSPTDEPLATLAQKLPFEWHHSRRPPMHVEERVSRDRDLRVSEIGRTRLDRDYGLKHVSTWELTDAIHTWPKGDPYLSESVIDVVPRDWGNEVILDFFDRH